MKDPAGTNKELVEEISLLKQRIQELEHSESELKRVQEVLRKSEEKYSQLSENANDAILSMDLDGIIRYANRAACDLASPLDLIGLSMQDITSANFLQNIPELLRKRREGDNSTFTFEWELTAPDSGRHIIMDVRSSLLTEHGKPSGVLIIARDVTDRKLWEEALRESEEKYRNLIVTTSEGFWLLDSDKKTIDVNQSLCDMLGYSRSEMIGKAPFDFVDDENLKIFKEHTSQITSTLHRTYEIMLKKKNGVNFPTIFNATSIIDKKGKPAGSFSFVTDTTDRKRTEGELLKTSERLELAMDAGEHGFWDWNLDTNDIYFSPSYYTMLGYEPGELPMKLETWINLMHPDDKKAILPKVENYVKNARTYEVEFRLKTKDGDWKWILGKGKSFKKDIDGNSHRALGVHINITALKKSEEDLKETLEHLRKSFGVTIQVMVSAIEARDPYTAGHQIRSADLARAIATEMGLPQEKIEGIRMAGSIHDIGKLSIPAEILSKPTRLTDIEFSLIKEHPRKGYEMLKNVESPWPLAEITYQHHERMNGSGYPRKLKGDEILMEARIMAVADGVEAMASHRPYRPALGISAALEEIEKNKGVLYDPEVVDACLRLFREKGFQLKNN